MVGIKKLGLTKSIGVSNYNKAQLEETISLGLENPVVNQVSIRYIFLRDRINLGIYSRLNTIP